MSGPSVRKCVLWQSNFVLTCVLNKIDSCWFWLTVFWCVSGCTSCHNERILRKLCHANLRFNNVCCLLSVILAHGSISLSYHSFTWRCMPFDLPVPIEKRILNIIMWVYLFYDFFHMKAMTTNMEPFGFKLCIFPVSTFNKSQKVLNKS